MGVFRVWGPVSLHSSRAWEAGPDSSSPQKRPHFPPSYASPRTQSRKHAGLRNYSPGSWFRVLRVTGSVTASLLCNLRCWESQLWEMDWIISKIHPNCLSLQCLDHPVASLASLNFICFFPISLSASATLKLLASLAPAHNQPCRVFTLPSLTAMLGKHPPLSITRSSLLMPTLLIDSHVYPGPFTESYLETDKERKIVLF